MSRDALYRLRCFSQGYDLTVSCDFMLTLGKVPMEHQEDSYYPTTCRMCDADWSEATNQAEIRRRTRAARWNRVLEE